MQTKKVTILGVAINATSLKEVVMYMNTAITGTICKHIITPNNEMLVEATRNAPFFDVLQQADYLLPDSTGLLLAARLTGQVLPCRVRGVDTMEQFCLQADAATNVFLLGAAPGIAAKAAVVLQSKNPLLQIVGTHSGSPSAAEAPVIIAKINASGANVLFVAYGAPAQDMWIASYKDQLPAMRIAMGVGGSFDFIAGTVRRAPTLLRTLGLEWLWRLALQPKRYKRMFTAVCIFPLLVLRYGRSHP